MLQCPIFSCERTNERKKSELWKYDKILLSQAHFKGGRKYYPFRSFTHLFYRTFLLFSHLLIMNWNTSMARASQLIWPKFREHLRFAVIFFFRTIIIILLGIFLIYDKYIQSAYKKRPMRKWISSRKVNIFQNDCEKRKISNTSIAIKLLKTLNELDYLRLGDKMIIKCWVYPTTLKKNPVFKV